MLHTHTHTHTQVFYFKITGSIIFFSFINPSFTFLYYYFKNLQATLHAFFNNCMYANYKCKLFISLHMCENEIRRNAFFFSSLID